VLAGLLDESGGACVVAQPASTPAKASAQQAARISAPALAFVSTISFLNDRILDHVDPIARSDLSFDRDPLTSILNQLAVERLVLADDQITLAVIGFQADRQPARDAFLRAINMLLAAGVVIDVTRHVDHLAGDFLRLAGRKVILRSVLMAFVS
jgi:hypothetical protein